MATGPYSRVYLSIVDDPMFEPIYGDNDALATWLRLLLVADAMYPASAPLPRVSRSIQLLIDTGLVQMRPGNRYAMRGLEAERERRSDAARNAAAVRWHSGSIARRDETSKDKQSNGQGPTSFIRYPARPERPPGEAVGVVHDGRHPASATCLACHPVLK